MKEEIPIFYQKILERLISKSTDGIIEKRRARQVLSNCFKIKKTQFCFIFHELFELGLIEMGIDKNRFIRINGTF